MENIEAKIAEVSWPTIVEDMHSRGFSLVPNFILESTCVELIKNYHQPVYRKTVVMERFRFGLGEYKYFNYPLPSVIQNIRENLYPKLVPIANLWMKVLNMEKEFPATFDELQNLCHSQGQHFATPLILKYGKGGFNTLHQDLYGEVYFPIQAVLFLNQPDVDYTGGEFVLTQQTPRAQSKAIVLKPKKGDMLIFTTNFRPLKGSKGHYRVNMKHGVSEVQSGERHTLGIIFHDALS